MSIRGHFTQQQPSKRSAYLAAQISLAQMRALDGVVMRGGGAGQPGGRELSEVHGTRIGRTLKSLFDMGLLSKRGGLYSLSRRGQRVYEYLVENPPSPPR